MTALSSPVLRAQVVDAPSEMEWWFVYVVLFATAVIPGLSDKYQLPIVTGQVFWSIAYVIAGHLLLRRTQVVPLFRRFAALWHHGDGHPIWSIAYVIAGAQLLLKESRIIQLFRRYAPLLALNVLMLVSTAWSINPSTTIIDGIELLGTTLIGFYIATRFTILEFLRILAIVFASIFVLSIVIVFVNPGYGRSLWGAGPWQGIYQDKNILGAATSLAIISQLILFPITRGSGRWLLFAGILFAGLLLVKSNSATAFGDCAAVIVVTFIPFACRSRRFGAFARFATILGVTVIISSIFAFGLTTENVYSALGRSSDLTSRANFWPYLGQAISDRPLLGYGFDAFFQSPLSDQYLEGFVVQAGGWTPYHAHDSFLQTELDAGYLGLAALIIVVLASLRNAVVYFARERSVVGIFPLAVILFLTFGSYTETYYLNYNSLEWILLVAAIVYPELDRKYPSATAVRWKRNDRL